MRNLVLSLVLLLTLHQVLYAQATWISPGGSGLGIGTMGGSVAGFPWELGVFSKGTTISPPEPDPVITVIEGQTPSITTGYWGSFGLFRQNAPNPLYSTLGFS